MRYNLDEKITRYLITQWVENHETIKSLRNEIIALENSIKNYSMPKLTIHMKTINDFTTIINQELSELVSLLESKRSELSRKIEDITINAERVFDVRKLNVKTFNTYYSILNKK